MKNPNMFHAETIKFTVRPNLAHRICKLNSGESCRLEAFRLSKTENDSTESGWHADIADAAVDN
jgi:hypothetical protein